VIDDLKKYLNGQRILIISPKFFGYETRIAKQLEMLGASSVWLDDRPNNSVGTKIIMRYFPFLYRRLIKDYYYKNINDAFDQILAISAESLSYEILIFLKEKTKANKIILYLYDSLENKKRLLSLIKYFDKCLTFDPDDAKRYNFIFRPLFFTSGMQKNKFIQTKYDVSFIGTGHSDRGKIIRHLKRQCDEFGLCYFFYLYLQTPLVYYFYKIFKWKQFRGIKKANFHYKPLGYDEYISISEYSRVIIDIEHPNQKGLTIRSLEMLGKGKKIITTNSNIKKYDFYNSSNFIIIDRNNPKIDKSFFKNEYKKIPDNIYYKYSINSWLEDIFL
jgi:hypothetical protein